MPAFSGEVSAADSAGAEKRDVHDTEEHREQGGRRRRLARAAHERWLQVRI